MPPTGPLRVAIVEDDQRSREGLALLVGGTPGIREAHEGGAPMSPEIARQVVTLFRRTAPAVSGEPLTPQEVRLLGLLAEGYSYVAAGGQLNISVNTVRNYIRTIYDKLHVHSKSEAVRKAIRKGIIK